jgi:hypothetical protein
MKDNILKYISIFFFILFFINILIGKFNNMYDMDIYHFGDVAEFLLLLISSTSIIIVAIDLENKDKNSVQ